MRSNKYTACLPSAIPIEQQIKQAMITYVTNYIEHHGEDKTTQQLFFTMRKTGFSPVDDLHSLYRNIRIGERKVPCLYALSSLPEREDRNIDVQYERLDELFKFEERESSIVVSFSATEALIYRKEFHEDGQRTVVALQEPTLEGFFYFSPTFFTQLDLPKRKESTSAMRNIAKTFIKSDGNNYVALLQYLSPESRTSEHYHSLDEVILQVAGKSVLELRPTDDDTQKREIELVPRTKIKIPAYTLHVLYTEEQGSVTLPFKQTIPGKNDHHYQDRSEARISNELTEFFLERGYKSGTARVTTLQSYYQTLNDEEQRTFQKVLRQRIAVEDNENVKDILNTFISQI